MKFRLICRQNKIEEIRNRKEERGKRKEERGRE
jgi:hypothetical protein